MISWFGFLSFVGHDTYLPIDSERAGFCFRGLVAAWRFQRDQGEKCFLGRNGFGWDTDSWRRFHSLILPGGKDIRGVILLFFFLTYPTHLDGGCLARRDEAGRLEIPFALFCSFGQAGMATYGNPFIL